MKKYLKPLASVVALVLVASLASPAAAEEPITQMQAAEHCPNHAAIEAAGFKVDDNESKVVKVVDQDGVEHDLRVTNSGQNVTFELLTEGYDLVSVEFCVKGGSQLPITGVISTETGGYTHPQNISYTVVYSIVTERDNGNGDGEWCSPGYWRQPHHLDAWGPTGYHTTDKYSAEIGPIERTRQGVREGAPTDPTLLQVLQNPQWYGGEAFNNVGDLLSGAHPDVDFDGTRVEDSCPL